MTQKKNVVLSCTLILSLSILLFLPQTTSSHENSTFKDGDVIVGGLFNIHYSETGDQCDRLSTIGLGYAEAMIFAIERINENSTRT